MDRIQSPEGLDAVVAPQSIVVVGASPRSGSVGRLVLEALLNGGYQGKVWVVHPTASEVLGVPAYPTIDDLPEVPDLAVLVIPAAAVLAVAEACGRRGVAGLQVITAGFRETGQAGAELEERLEQIVRRHGMRMIGPNCVGVLNVGLGFDTVFAPHAVHPGHTAILSQSGAVGLGLLHLAHQRGLGVAGFFSLGNKADVSGNDLLMRWETDEDVRLIVFYLEGFGNPRNFVRIARRVTKKKPILLVKSGRSPAGSRAASSHTGALADSDRTVDDMLRQCGILRFDTIQALFDAALAFDKGAVAEGDRIAIVTNSGGPAIMATDALAARGLRMATLGDKTLDALRGLLPPAAAFSNPVDTLAGVDATRFGAALRLVMDDPGVDAVIAIHTSVFEDQLELVGPLAACTAKPLYAVLYGASDSRPRTALSNAGVPAYGFPEEAVEALAATRTWSRWRDQPLGDPVLFPDVPAPDGDGWVTLGDALGYLGQNGIPVVPHATVHDLEAARHAAGTIGYPVVLKADRTDVVHKSDAGLVALDIRDDAALQAAWHQVTHKAPGALRWVLVMQHARAGLELLLGAVQDPRYGPLVAFGLGGTQAEALQDVHFRLAPLTRANVDDLVDELRAKALLGAFRGQPARDTEALKQILLRLGSLAWKHPEVAELDINPLRLYADGAVVVDARIRIEKPSGPSGAATGAIT